MDQAVGHIFEIEVLTASSQVAFIVPVTLEVTIDTSD